MMPITGDRLRAGPYSRPNQEHDSGNPPTKLTPFHPLQSGLIKICSRLFSRLFLAAHPPGAARLSVVVPGGQSYSVVVPAGQRTRILFGGLPSGNPKKPAAVDWL